MTLPEVDPEVGDTEKIRVQDVKVTFFDVSTSDNFHRATAKRMTGSAMMPYDSISASARSPRSTPARATRAWAWSGFPRTRTKGCQLT